MHANAGTTIHELWFAVGGVEEPTVELICSL